MQQDSIVQILDTASNSFSGSFDNVAVFISMLGTIVTLVVLFLTKKDISILKKHQLVLKEHEQKLQSVRPLYSMLITDEKEIMELAIDSTIEAKEIHSLGTISSILKVEKLNGEDENKFNERVKKVKPHTKEYIKAISDFILAGKEYCRIINLLPSNTQSNIDEILSNITFFCRLLEFNGHTAINIKLYHNSEILSDNGDYHFRVSDKKVVIRIGGHGNTKSNSAIVITDTNVIDEFKNYYNSLTQAPNTVELNYDLLLKIKHLLEQNDVDSIAKILTK